MTRGANDSFTISGGNIPDYRPPLGAGDSSFRGDPSFREVLQRLRDLCGRFRRYVAWEGLARTLWFVLFCVGGQLVLEWFATGLQWSMRAALLGTVVAGVAWQLWRRVLAPLRVRFDVSQAARLLERRHPELASVLVSAVRFDAGQVGPEEVNSRDLVNSVVSQAGRRAAAIDFKSVLDTGRARRSGFATGAGLLLAVILVLIFPEMARLWLVRDVFLQEEPWPKRTTLVVEAQDGVIYGARGDDLVIQAHAEGVQPREVEIFFETQSGRRGRESMTTVGRSGAYRYRYTFNNAQEDFEFSLRGGDDRTDTFRSKLRDRPRVVGSALSIKPPEYTRLDPLTLAPNRRSAQILHGSEVTLRIQTNHAVVSAVLMSGRDPVAEASEVDTDYTVSITAAKTGTYHFRLLDSFELENRHPVHFSLQVVQDAAPRVRMKLPGVGEMITADAVLPIELEYADDLGLASAQWVHQIFHAPAEGGTPAESEAPAEGGSPTGGVDSGGEDVHAAPSFDPYVMTLNTSVRWPVADESVVPGDRLLLFARAEDFNTVSGPGVGRSPEVPLRVVTRDELLAELARREQRLRMDFERLVDTQEKLRSTLLTLAARSSAGGDAGELRSPQENRSPQEYRPPQELSQAGASAERTQRHIAGSVNIIRQQFERILAEMAVNQLANEKVKGRLGERIIGPLSRLARRDLLAAADDIQAWSIGGGHEIGAGIDSQQVSLLSQMREILANMIQWEGYQEVVNMLRDILERQKGLNAESRAGLEADAADIFEDDD